MFKSKAALNRFTIISTKWIETTGAVGIISKSGRYDGTYAHSEIALEFASWISQLFKLYIVQDYKKLKTDENSKLSFNWILNMGISNLRSTIKFIPMQSKSIC